MASALAAAVVVAAAFSATALLIENIGAHSTEEALSEAARGIAEELSGEDSLPAVFREMERADLAGAVLLGADGRTIRAGLPLPFTPIPGPFAYGRSHYYAVRKPIHRGILIVFTNDTEEESRVLHLRLGLFALWIPLSAVVGLVGWIAAGWTTRELSALAQQAARIEAAPTMGRLGASQDQDFAPLVDSLNDLLSRIEAEIESQKRLVADVAHDLRTPLTVIRGRLEMALSRPRTPEQYRDAASAALEETLRLQALSEATLVLGEATQSLEEVELGVEAEAAFDRWRPRFASAGAALGLDRETALVRGVPALVGRLFDNLLDNALKHVSTGGRCKVTIRCSPREVEVWVDDDGPGIPPQDRQRVFERFARGDRSRSRAAEGFGIGLASCASIVAAMGGAIRVEESPFGGARLAMAFLIVEESSP